MVRRRTTIMDIARRAGVSVGTVSNILNGKGRHADSTRGRVLQAASELHFTPNALIRSLQSGKTHTIGVFTWRVRNNASHFITMRLLEGIADGIATIQYDTLLYSRHPHEGEIPVAYFLDGRVDGLIIAPGGLTAQGLEALVASGLPAIALYQGTVPGLGSVNIDNRAGLLAAIEHLVALGHRRIALYTPDYTYDYQQRRDGYRLGLERAGIACDPALCVTAAPDFQTGIEAAFDRLLALPEPPTAVIAGDDGTAMSVWAELNRRGLAVPEAMSLIGFDDAPVASGSPGLTTIHQPAEEIGRIAAQFVFRLLSGRPAEECRAVLPVELIARDTTAPPRAR
jgi:LacI family transcriptional regulator